MKLLVTGGSGLLGSKIAELAENEYEVFSGYSSHEPEFGEPVRFDLVNEESVLRALKEVKPDVIVHSAAMTDVDRCEVEKNLTYAINVKGTELIADFARKNGCFLVYVSTDYVFDGEKGMYREENDVNPINYYGFTKLLGERACKSFCIARTCVIYGARPASGKVNFALWLVRNLEEGKEVKAITDQFVTPTLNTNLAEMILEIVERRIEGVLHLAGATRVSRFEFALEIAKIFGFDESLIKPAKMSEMKWTAKRPKDSSLDVSKAKKILKKKPMELKTCLHKLKREMVVQAE